jgi:hypothetical protein
LEKGWLKIPPVMKTEQEGLRQNSTSPATYPTSLSLQQNNRRNHWIIVLIGIILKIAMMMGFRTFVPYD